MLTSRITGCYGLRNRLQVDGGAVQVRASPRDLPAADVAWSGDLRCHRAGSAGRARQRAALGTIASGADRALRVAV
jgi:hypothetical protein